MIITLFVVGLIVFVWSVSQITRVQESPSILPQIKMNLSQNIYTDCLFLDWRVIIRALTGHMSVVFASRIKTGRTIGCTSQILTLSLIDVQTG